MPRLSTIELFNERMKFAAGHFTILSSTKRENLHGHNYQVHACFTTIVEDEGMTFDYRFYKEKMLLICKSLNETTLVPGASKYIRTEEHGNYCHVYFNDEKMIFAKRDITILPITNVTVEELSNYILNRLLQDSDELERNRMQKIKVKVFSAPGQGGSTTWRKERE